MTRLLAPLLLALVLLLVACRRPPLLDDVRCSPDVFTPNADGDTDLATFEFLLTRNAWVSILLRNTEGDSYTFRSPTRLSVQEEPYTVYFAGIVEPYFYPGESYPFTLSARMIPDGVYTWEIRAEADDGEIALASGTVSISDADVSLPAIRELRVAPAEITPNQDGLNDAAELSFVLDKDLASLAVDLVWATGLRQPWIEAGAMVGAPGTPLRAGLQTFIYDTRFVGDPPEDGSYPVVVQASDRAGQTAVATGTLKLHLSGTPRVYVVNKAVEWSARTLVLSETLCFTTTIQNDSETYLRTVGPWSGSTYRGDTAYAPAGWPESTGAFRLAVDFDTSLEAYPYRWGLGKPGVELVEIDGEWYLPPQGRSVITGCIQVVDVAARNPQYYWVGLLHEGRVTDAGNVRVSSNFVTVWAP